MAKILEDVIILKVSYLVKDNSGDETVFNNEVETAITELAQQVIDGVRPGAIVEVERP